MERLEKMAKADIINEYGSDGFIKYLIRNILNEEKKHGI